MTLTDAARALGKAPATIHAMIARGELEAGRAAGKLVVVRASVEALVESMRATA